MNTEQKINMLQNQLNELYVEDLYEKLHALMQKTNTQTIEVAYIEIEDLDGLGTIIHLTEDGGGFDINTEFEENNINIIADLELASLMQDKGQSILFNKETTLQDFKKHFSV